MVDKILFRLNAGKKFGMGHLSRNLTLAEVFSENNFQCKFLIESDDKEKVELFLKSKDQAKFQIEYFKEDLSLSDDVSNIINHCKREASFLILDHYNHDFQYQEKLKNAGIRWAQFDYKKNEEIFSV